MLKAIVLIVGLFFLGAVGLSLCWSSQKRSQEAPTITVIEKQFFERMFLHNIGWHEPTMEVSMWWEENGEIKYKTLSSMSNGSYDKIYIFSDIPVNEKCYYEITKNDNFIEKQKDVSIHIHSLNELSPGGWDHGKHGSNMNNSLE